MCGYIKVCLAIVAQHIYSTPSVCVCVCWGDEARLLHSDKRTPPPPLLAACTCAEWWVSYLRRAAILKQLLDIQFFRILDLLDKLEETARYAVSDEGGTGGGGVCTWPHPFCLPTPDSLRLLIWLRRYFITHSPGLKIQYADKTFLQLNWCQGRAS